ncbi:hypothetical protein yrohd0001_37980 [Yersinia rohdei ATCC 43380]|nr:hypothetical protein yrohd0001_37980 [Yersinia rohdei ATCC 43380]
MSALGLQDLYEVIAQDNFFSKLEPSGGMSFTPIWAIQ